MIEPSPLPAAAADKARRVVYIVLPAFNEEANMALLLQRLRETMEDNFIRYETIVVDDGSRDQTAEVVQACAREMPLTLVRHPTNLGLGAAVRDGLQAALERAADRDVIVTMDADDTHTPGLIVRMVRMMGEGYDVLIASRYQPESRVYGVPVMRRFMSAAASLLLRILFPIRGVRDFTCGYRAYRAAALRRAVAHYQEDFVNQEGFQCMVDILLKLRRMPLIFGEVPLLLRYDLKGGKSKMNVWQTARQTLGLLFRRRLGY